MLPLTGGASRLMLCVNYTLWLTFLLFADIPAPEYSNYSACFTRSGNFQSVVFVTLISASVGHFSNLSGGGWVEELSWSNSGEKPLNSFWCFGWKINWMFRGSIAIRGRIHTLRLILSVRNICFMSAAGLLCCNALYRTSASSLFLCWPCISYDQSLNNSSTTSSPSQMSF